jgi:bifunctional pyridoxal-dependent enzyme with beta-cystathionase and maltose regulon repressor activities
MNIEKKIEETIKHLEDLEAKEKFYAQQKEEEGNGYAQVAHKAMQCAYSNCQCLLISLLKEVRYGQE